MIHPTAVVDRHAEIDPSAEVGPCAVIGPKVKIGPRTRVGPHAVIEGDTVYHDKWGEGVVLSVTGMGARAMATIAFGDVGEKSVMLEYAPLSKR